MIIACIGAGVASFQTGYVMGVLKRIAPIAQIRATGEVAPRTVPLLGEAATLVDFAAIPEPSAPAAEEPPHGIPAIVVKTARRAEPVAPVRREIGPKPSQLAATGLPEFL
jgi:hypothetical protein